MSQESNERSNQSGREGRMNRPPWYRPAGSPMGGSPHQQPPSQPVRPIRREQDERITRLRELRRQRQQSGYDAAPPDMYTFRRRGIPTPPPAQPSFQEMVKHWWYNGPFAGQSPAGGDKKHVNQQGPITTRQRPPLSRQPFSSFPSSLEQRIRAWLTQGQLALTRLSARVRDAIHQITKQMEQKAKNGQRSSSQRSHKRNHRL
jgi:hypothetical protein